jgi:hypothetical protein
MTPEQDKYLCEKYPKIFKNRNGSIKDTCIAWGFECGSGWVRIIDTLCEVIQHHVDWKVRLLSVEERDDFQVVANQVKEKFGGLRFYYSGGDDVIQGMVHMAEHMSYKTCESCGSPGSGRAKNKSVWIGIRCDSCEKDKFSDLEVPSCD